MSKLSANGVNGEKTGLEYDLVAYFFLAAVVLLSYGYEIFNFNLTIDEEAHAIHAGRLHMDWISQGRWGMALLNYFVLQNPIVPAVSVSLGLVGTVAGLFTYFRSAYPADRLGLSAVVALAVTVPTLAFTYTFSTLAYGVGFAFLAISTGFSLMRRHAWWSFALACLLTAFAISVYQTFVFVVAMLALASAVNSWDRNNPDVLGVLWKMLAYVLGSFAIYLFVNYAVLAAVGQEASYVGQYIDLKGFVEHPLERSLTSAQRVLKTLRLRSEVLGVHSIWLVSVVFIAISFSLVFPLLKRQYGLSLRAGVIALGVLGVMVFADAIAPGGAPLRSVIYIPVGVAIIVANGYMTVGKIGKRVLVSLSALAIIGNSMINNHLHASSKAAEYKDRVLAHTIMNAVLELNEKAGGGASLFKVELIGSHAWPATPVQTRSETFGASFFEWDAGNRWRVAAYLNLNGLPAVGASDEDRVRVRGLGETMPAWPNDGWVALSGDIVILKFGEYSIPQRKSLCKLGAIQLCD
jgi:hypothetical protein